MSRSMDSFGLRISTARWSYSANLKHSRFSHRVRASTKSLFNNEIIAVVITAEALLVDAKWSFAAIGNIAAENQAIAALEYRPLN